MLDLTGSDDCKLSNMVLSDTYFTVERDNIPFLLALVAEEFYYTPVQHDILINNLNLLSKG